MCLILPNEIAIAIGFVLLPLIFFLVCRFLVYPLWRRRQMRKHGNDEWYGQWSRFTDDNGVFWGGLIVTLAGCLIAIICLIVMGVGLSNNHALEPQTYAAYKTEYNSLTEIIETTDDLVNTNIYMRINEYNKEIAAFQSQYNNPSLRFNFTGDYDWNALQLITLEGGS